MCFLKRLSSNYGAGEVEQKTTTAHSRPRDVHPSTMRKMKSEMRVMKVDYAATERDDSPYSVWTEILIYKLNISEHSEIILYTERSLLEQK